LYTKTCSTIPASANIYTYVINVRILHTVSFLIPHNDLAPWSRSLIGKLMVLQEVKEFRLVYEIWTFYWSLSRVRWIHFI